MLRRDPINAIEESVHVHNTGRGSGSPPPPQSLSISPESKSILPFHPRSGDVRRKRRRKRNDQAENRKNKSKGKITGGGSKWGDRERKWG
jgi:hypothetical protein